MKKYSGKQVIKAGERLIDDDLLENDDAFSEVAEIVSYWRFTHESALEKAFLIVQRVSSRHDRQAIFAKRLKRLVSIRSKLKRFEKMKLKNMQDIGGCRVILSSPKKTSKVLRELKKMPEFRGKDRLFRLKDYNKFPKDDGYRSYHLIGGFENSRGERKYIEVQLRTRLQHYWATALEIVDIFTGQALKSNMGEKAWESFFKNVSAQFSIMESIHVFEDLDVGKQFREYQKRVLSSDEGISSCKDVKCELRACSYLIPEEQGGR